MESVLKVMNYEGPLQKRPLPTFIKKLWFLLSDSASQDYIFWVDNGQVICIPNATTFSQNILPRFFKHSNWQSFVRQLNLYGFRKVYQLNLTYDDSAEKRTVWQFKHASFKRDAPEKLCEISRRANKSNTQRQVSLSPSPPPPLQPSSSSSSTQNDESAHGTPNTSALHSSTDNLTSIHVQIQNLNQRILQLDRKCQELNNEAIQLRTLQISQQNSINSLAHCVQCLINKDPELTADRCFQFSFQHLLRSTSQNGIKPNYQANGNSRPLLSFPPISTSPSSKSPYPTSPLFSQVSPSSTSCNNNTNNNESLTSDSSPYYTSQQQQQQGLPPISSLIGDRSTRTISTLESPKNK